MTQTLSARRLSDLSAAVTKLARRYGRSPKTATSWRLDDGCVITALDGFMTPAETALAEEGAAPLVRQMRVAFGEAIDDEYVTAAESGLGRRVIAHRTQMCESGICLEIFLLGADDDPPAGAPLLNSGWHNRPELS